MSRLAIKAEVLRALFAHSGNQCAFPGCTHPLISQKGNFIAQICHIEAANIGGPRYNPNQTDEERRAVANLTLFCYPHHKETDDEQEFSVEHLRKIKAQHEQQFQNKFQLANNELEKVMHSIEAEMAKINALSVDTNNTVHLMTYKLDELLKRIPAPVEEEEKQFTAKIEFIKELKIHGNYITAIEQLLQLKEKYWTILRPATQYRVLVNLGMWYMDLHDKANASKYLIELHNIDYETADSLALLCLGYTLAGRNTEFDSCFPKAIVAGPENVNLWVAYLDRYKKEKEIEALQKELPASVVGTVPVLHAIGSRLIEEGRKKEGLALLRKILSNPDNTKVSQMDNRAQIATIVIKDIIDPFKFVYDHFTTEEYRELEEAKEMLTEVWDAIGNTEIARCKWFVILNRGVINKVTRQSRQAIMDFQKAFELSSEFLAFKNLLMMHLQMKDLAMVEQLLKDPGIKRSLTIEEQFEMVAFKARLLSLQQKYTEGVSLLEKEYNKGAGDTEPEILSIIIGTCLQYGDIDRASPWCEVMLKQYPSTIESYLLAGRLSIYKNQLTVAKGYFQQAASMLSDATPYTELYGLATGYMDLHAYENAIPLFERLADKNRFNEFSRGLIYAYYQYGDLQAALALAENLFDNHSQSPLLTEIISNIYRETKQYDKAIATIEKYLPTAHQHLKDVFVYRVAALYAQKREWDNTRKWALQVQHLQNFTMVDIFSLAGILIKAGAPDKALEIAFDARTRFFDSSEAHLKYTSVCIEVKKSTEEIFPNIVRMDCAVFCEDENGELKTLLITSKQVKNVAVINVGSPLAIQLLGKTKGETVQIVRSFGLKGTIKILQIMNIYTYAFQESMDLFETQFAGQQPVAVIRAAPGQPGDQLEQFIKADVIDKKDYEKKLYHFYSQQQATLGMLAGLFKKNAVMQWFVMSGHADVSLISFTQNEYPAVNQVLNRKQPLILDLTALLSVFFVYEQTDFLETLDNNFIVSQSIVDVLQECYEDLERGATDGQFSMGYEDGRLVGHNIPKEAIRKHRDTIGKIIQWCRRYAHITPAVKVLQVKREERRQTSGVLGDCFYDSLLLAEEYQAAVVSDDAPFKQLLLGSKTPLPFSTWQLLQYLYANGKLAQNTFETWSFKLVLANYVYIPITGQQLWQAFDASAFQITKPFTVAIKGFIISRTDMCVSWIVQFLKKLYLESGLATTREQTVLYIFHEIAGRKDFEEFKKIFIQHMQTEFRFLPTAKDEILQLLSAFG